MPSIADQVTLVRILPAGEKIELNQLVDFVTIPETGGVVTFAGVVRETENGSSIEGLFYEHHAEMAQRELDRIVQAAMQRFDVQRIACIHCTGFVAKQEASVAIAVGSKHRIAAFDAC